MTSPFTPENDLAEYVGKDSGARLMTETLYKFLDLADGRPRSRHGNHIWTVGQWYGLAQPTQPLALCRRGFHASRTPLDALNYVTGAVLARVEVRGESAVEASKEAWSQMRLVDARLWTKRDSQELAVFAAELVLDIFEARRAGDNRPRDAIEAAKKYLRGDIELAELRAARAAAADGAYAAAHAAAYGAAHAAHAAHAAAHAAAAVVGVRPAGYAYAAYAAAAAAADAVGVRAASDAYAAADAAADAVGAYASGGAAARRVLKAKINDWIVARFETLELVD